LIGGTGEGDAPAADARELDGSTTLAGVAEHAATAVFYCKYESLMLLRSRFGSRRAKALPEPLAQ
jgi:hypothetical protein